MEPKTVMSGMRSTGSMHAGNYFGALKNWIELQNRYKCFFGVMDWHAMTDFYKSSDSIDRKIRIMFAEWIAIGIDPKKSILFIQSRIPEHLELFIILANLTPMGWLERVTTWKHSIEELKAKDAHNLGRFLYPVLQTVDIAIYKGELVPVGQDQIPHLEISRQIIRRFNNIYKTDILKEPKPLLTSTPLLMGTDGSKMSKSKNNFFPMIPEEKELSKLCNNMVTDPKRVYRKDPGNPDVCSVFHFHKLFSPNESVEEINVECRRAGIGCKDCKNKLSENINTFIEKPRQTKKQILDGNELDEIIIDGCDKARKVAKQTLKEVRSAMSFSSGVNR